MAYWNIYRNPDVSGYKGIDSFLAILLANRNISPSEIEYFLNPNYLFDPFLFDGMKTAVSRIKKAIKNKEKILIYGDYDVDGISATSILWDFLYNKMHANAFPFIPSRFTEGYGLNGDKLKEFAKEGYTLVITVDCGIRDTENALLAKKLGIDLIITDHHLISENIPKSFVNIHPALGYGRPEICGAAVAYKLACALNKKNEFDMSEYLDLVCLATICDVSKLIGENRAFVNMGLEIINSRKRPGIDSLIKVSNIDEVDVYHIGFVIGPKINAPGRLYDPIHSLRLLSTKNKKAAENLSSKLHQFNIERQNMTKNALEEAWKQIDGSDFFNIVVSNNWGEGIIGLVAGKITEESGKPTIAITSSESKGVYVGSARSIENFNIVDMLDKGKEYLIKYGGHEAAAGLQIKFEDIPKLKLHANNYAKEFLKGRIRDKVLKIDFPIHLKNINYDLYNQINLLKPFGVGNPQPIFVSYSCIVMSASNVGNSKKFVKLRLTDKEKNIYIDSIWFSSIYTPEEIVKFGNVDIAFNITENTWNGKSDLQLKILDLKPHSS
jgi:single-stranded-DNA-specific exonuclease